MDLNGLEKSAFNCARNLVEHMEITINKFMQENDISLENWQRNGSYEEIETVDGRMGVIKYSDSVFHKFKYNALGIIYDTWDK